MKKKIYDPYTGYHMMTSSGIEIHRYKTSDVKEVESHIHDFFEVYCLLEGNICFEVEEYRYHLSKENILLIPPGVRHGVKIESENYERIILWINPWYLNRISSRKTQLSQCFVLAKNDGFLFKTEPSIRKSIIAVLFELIYETHEKEFGYDLMRDSCLKKLLILLSRYKNLNIIKNETNIEKIILYINQHYTEDINLEFLCDKFFISKFYLSRSFKNVMGKSIYQYILEKRMIMARQLLVYGEKPMDIYTICGFKHYSNFYRVFKNYYKVSPKTFIENMALDES